MKYTTKFFKEKGAKGGTTTKEKMGIEHYSNMGKQSAIIRKKLKEEKLLTPPLDTTPLL